MKVYAINPAEPYSGGVILIAANSKKEAKSLIPYKFVKFTKPEEVKDLVANISVAQVIINYIYLE